MSLMEKDFAPLIWYELELLDLHHQHGTLILIYQTYILHSSNFLFLFTYPSLKTKTEGEAKPLELMERDFAPLIWYD
jgi:hypothetical protein